MTDEETFADLVRRLRTGDAGAAAELVRQYEPVIRLEARVRLHDLRLRRLLDSLDISQMVLGSFLVRASAGQYDLDRPEDLVKLLVGMARHKLAFEARKQYAQRRDVRRRGDVSRQVLESVPGGPDPGEQVAEQELLREFRQRLSAEERQLADLRSQGLDWAGVAARVGGTAQARRKQLDRAVERVAQELGLEEGGHG